MKLGELLQMLEGYNPETEVYIISRAKRHSVLGVVAEGWGKRIEIYAAVKPLKLEEIEE
jgi:hypothetical protein